MWFYILFSRIHFFQLLAKFPFSLVNKLSEVLTSKKTSTQELYILSGKMCVEWYVCMHVCLYVCVYVCVLSMVTY